MVIKYAMFSTSLESSESVPNVVELGILGKLVVRGSFGDQNLLQ